MQKGEKLKQQGALYLHSPHVEVTQANISSFTFNTIGVHARYDWLADN